MDGCHTCELLIKRDVGDRPLWDNIYRTDYWDLVHSYNTALYGWLCLVCRRHLAAVDELTEPEAAELGLLIRRVSIALREATHCTKTYVVQFAEALGHQHVHFHIIPRMSEQPEDKKGTNIFGYLGVPEDQRVSEDAMNEVAARIRHFLLTSQVD